MTDVKFGDYVSLQYLDCTHMWGFRLRGGRTVAESALRLGIKSDDVFLCLGWTPLRVKRSSGDYGYVAPCGSWSETPDGVMAHQQSCGHEDSVLIADNTERVPFNGAMWFYHVESTLALGLERAIQEACAVTTGRRDVAKALRLKALAEIGELGKETNS